MRRLLLFLLLASPAFAALGVNTVFELNTGATANNANGGGFNPRNANMDTDLSCTSPTTTAPVCSSATYNFVAGDANNWLFVQAGTNWNTNGAGTNGKGGGCWFKISSVAANAATVNATVGAAVCISDGIAGNGANTASDCIPCWVTNSLQGIANSSYVSGTASGTWSVDYSQGTAAAIAYTDLVIGATTTQYTSVANPVGKNIIGNLISTNSGTNCTVQRNEVVSTAGTTATTDKSLGTAASTCTSSLGGAISLNSAVTNNTDSTLFGLATGTNGTGGMVFWMKNGTFTLGVAVTTGAGSSQAHAFVIGYNATRADHPTIASGNQPIINAGANPFTLGSQFDLWDSQWVGTGTSVIFAAASNIIYNSKITNQSTTANRSGIDMQFAQVSVIASELVSYRGPAVKVEAAGQLVNSSWMHDSDIGMSNAGGGAQGDVFNSLFTTNVTEGYNQTNGSGPSWNFSNTYYGREGKQGTCVNLPTTTTNFFLVNNIIYGCVTGVAQADTSQAGYDDYNDFFNNTTDVTKWFKGPHDLAVNPTFTSAVEHTCVGTCSSATNVVTDTTGGFNAYILNDVHFYHCLTNCGTGGAGVYPIHAHTDTTLTLATPQNVAVTIGTQASGQTYSITSGLNWNPTAGVLGVGFPASFGSSSTNNFPDIGAVQPQDAAGSTQHNSAFVQ